ncbi:MAG: hypothetical protein ACLPX9_14045 [Rhodomicrobium sp.]
MKSTQRKALRATFDELQTSGLTDIKFFLVNIAEATTEDVCRDVNSFLSAICEGKTVDHDWNDSGGLQHKAA